MDSRTLGNLASVLKKSEEGTPWIWINICHTSNSQMCQGSEQLCDWGENTSSDWRKVLCTVRFHLKYHILHIQQEEIFKQSLNINSINQITTTAGVLINCCSLSAPGNSNANTLRNRPLEGSHSASPSKPKYFTLSYQFLPTCMI